MQHISVRGRGKIHGNNPGDYFSGDFRDFNRGSYKRECYIEAARRVKELNSESYAAIGTKFASDVYGLKILHSKIEDNLLNSTRFLIISKKENIEKEGKIKTSILFVTRHIPGALYRVLKLYADAEINLLKIESRPRRRGRWEYIFIMDFEGDKDNPKVKKVLENMNEIVIWHKILGSYPMT